MPEKNFPQASDILLHAKDEENNERLIFPITRYANIIAAPKMTNDIESSFGSPFLLLVESSVEIDEDELRNLCRALN